MHSSDVSLHMVTFSSGKVTLVPGTLERLRRQVHAFMTAQQEIGEECLGTSREHARVLLRCMCGLLMSIHHDSSIRGEVAVGLATLEATEFMILPEMSGQRFSGFHHPGTLATTPLGQAAMMFANMGTELSSKPRYAF